MELISLCFYSYYLIWPAWYYKDFYWIFYLFTFLPKPSLSSLYSFFTTKKTVSQELHKMKKDIRDKNIGNLLVEQDKVIQNFWAITVTFSLSSSHLHAWYCKSKGNFLLPIFFYWKIHAKHYIRCYLILLAAKFFMCIYNLENAFTKIHPLLHWFPLPQWAECWKPSATVHSNTAEFKLRGKALKGAITSKNSDICFSTKM